MNTQIQALWLRKIAAVAAACLLSGMAFGAEITTVSLLREMTDLRGLAEYPGPAFTTRQFSSYDRKSDQATGASDPDWFANHDRGHFLRVEERDGRKEYVMMDARGPGAVVRIWSADPVGILRIYLDGSESPVVEAPMADLLAGKVPGFPEPLTGIRARGYNLYFPIPYARQCRITSDQGGFYYHVNYRTYAAGTAVESFSMKRLAELESHVKAAAKGLVDGAAPMRGGEPFEFVIPAGGRTHQRLEGPSAISGCVLRVAASEMESALRGVILRMTFDGEACVEAPLGDFFGTAPGANVFASMPLGFTKDGEWYCNWFMPFARTAEIELVNHTGQEIQLEGRLGQVEYNWTDASMHFHAKWLEQSDVKTRPYSDWRILHARGKGVFAGLAYFIDNFDRAWWGEGDEKIFVDGERFPGTFGTGTEDYFGYAWSANELFTHAYHAQPRSDGPGNYGRSSVNRFHVLDRMPFERELRFDMELWHWADCRVNLAAVAYWYARPGATDQFKAIRPEQAVVQSMPPYTPPRVPGAIEGETLAIVRVNGRAEPQAWTGLSNDSHLWWRSGMKPGDQLVLSFPSETAGRFRLFGRFLKARDYGIHQLAVNGRNAGEPVDFYAPNVEPSSELDLGMHELRAGINEFSITVRGANSNAEPAYMFGLDYLRIAR